MKPNNKTKSMILDSFELASSIDLYMILNGLEKKYQQMRTDYNYMMTKSLEYHGIGLIVKNHTFSFQTEEMVLELRTIIKNQKYELKSKLENNQLKIENLSSTKYPNKLYFYMEPILTQAHLDHLKYKPYFMETVGIPLLKNKKYLTWEYMGPNLFLFREDGKNMDPKTYQELFLIKDTPIWIQESLKNFRLVEQDFPNSAIHYSSHMERKNQKQLQKIKTKIIEKHTI